IRSIDASRRLAGDRAAVVVLPRGTGGMMTDDGSLIVGQLGFRRLEGPLRLAVLALPADVDLHAGRTRPQQDSLPGADLDRIGNFGGICRLRVRERESLCRIGNLGMGYPLGMRQAGTCEQARQRGYSL